MRVLVALDKFKDALSAERACAVVERELRRMHPDWSIDLCPLSDGGEGFGRLLTDAAQGSRIEVPAKGPRLEPRYGSIGWVATSHLPARARTLLARHVPLGERIGVLEMAEVNGLALLSPDARDALWTSTYGTGELLRAASWLGAELLVLGIGGSATSDLGFGALAALGFAFRDETGQEITPPFPANFRRIRRVEGRRPEGLPPLLVAHDVSNPLLGPNGAAATFGRQKGLDGAALLDHEAESERLASLLCRHAGVDASLARVPGTGAAGGLGFGLLVGTGARLVSGFELVAAWTDLDRRLEAADLLITGEGRFDGASLSGKGPGEVVRRAVRAGRRWLVLAGTIDESTRLGFDSGRAVAITPPGTPIESALAQTERNLARTVAAELG